MVTPNGYRCACHGIATKVRRPCQSTQGESKAKVINFAMRAIPFRLLPLSGRNKEHPSYCTRGSEALPTAPPWSAPCHPPSGSRKKERLPVRPYEEGIAES